MTDSTRNTRSRIPGSHYLSSKRHEARIVQMREEGSDSLELEDHAFNQQYRVKGADLPARQKIRPLRERRILED